MEYYRDTWKLDNKPEKRLKVVIVGAGIAGLVAGLGIQSSARMTTTTEADQRDAGLKQSGHDVVVLEQAQEIAEVGAGIQMAPNNMR